MSYRNIRTPEDFNDFIKNKSVAVVGIGINNAPLLKFLKKCGVEKITARDKKNIFENGNAQELREIPGIDFILGGNYLDGLNEDIIFKTPGIRRDLIQFAQAERGGSILTSETELFLLICPAKIIAVTGSDGKSTTTTVIGVILKYAGENKKIGGNIYVGGNLGKPLIGEAEEMTSADYGVLELSSFQLFDLDNGRFNADYSVITNITPNHLDWHRDMQEYASAKKIIFKNQDRNKRVVLNYDCEATRILKDNEKIKPEVYFFSKDKLPESCENGVYCDGGGIIVRTGGVDKKIIDKSDILIRGEHNLQNFMAAIGVTHDIVGSEAIKKAAANFTGIEHRIEFVRENGGVYYYNSSIDSSPTRTIAAINYFDDFDDKEKNIIVLLGGHDKKIAFDPLVPVVGKKAKAAVLFGAAKDKIKKAFESNTGSYEALDLISADDFDSAVKKANELAESGDIVLLSPACTSFDAFKNFEERGNRFKELVREF